VLMEYDKITERGGVLGAMETGYQRSKIQDESMYYEMLKHTGEYPIVGVNTFRDPHADGADLLEGASCIDLARATTEEKESQLNRLKDFHTRNAEQAAEALVRLQKVALCGENIFAELMETVKCCSLGQITGALYDVGGQYRRNM
jgi:isobutyryl-CoA mutase